MPEATLKQRCFPSTKSVITRGSAMFETLNDMIGKILLVGILGAGAAYGGYKVLCGPPLLKQKGDTTPNRWERAATRQFDQHMRELHEDQARRFNDAMEVGRQVGS